MSSGLDNDSGLRSRGDCGCGGNEDASAPAAVTGGASAYKKGAAAFGRVYSVIGAIIGAIIAIICVFLGFSKLRDPHTSTVEATVTKVTSCAMSSQTNVVSYAYVASTTHA